MWFKLQPYNEEESELESLTIESPESQTPTENVTEKGMFISVLYNTVSYCS